MRLTFIMIIFLLFSNCLLAQSLAGVVLDNNSNLPIEKVNFTMLSGKQSFSSDSLGRFLISIKDTNDKLLVSCVGYQSVLVDLNNFIEDKVYEINLRLIPHVEELKEVVVDVNSKGNYTVKKVGIKKGTSLLYLVRSGYEVCTLVKTPFHEEQYVKAVILSVGKRTKKNVFMNHFKINFYEYDSVLKKPGTKINTDDIIVFPENKNYELKVDVNHIGISFPEEGLCVGVEIINTYGIPYDLDPKDISSKLKLKNFNDEKTMPAPYLGLARSKNDSAIQTWERCISKQVDWVICPVKYGPKDSDLNLKVNVEVKLDMNEK